MKNFQAMVLFLGGIPYFASIKQYRENRSFVDPDLSVGLHVAILPDIAQLIKCSRSFPDTC